MSLVGVVIGQNVDDRKKLMEMKKAMAAPVNSRDICERDPPQTSASQTPGDNGFRIKVSGRTQSDKYTPGQVYTGKGIPNQITKRVDLDSKTFLKTVLSAIKYPMVSIVKRMCQSLLIDWGKYVRKQIVCGWDHRG